MTSDTIAKTANMLTILLVGLTIFFHPILLILLVAKKITNKQVRYVVYLLIVLTIMNGVLWLISLMLVLGIIVAVWNYQEILLWVELLEPIARNTWTDILNNASIKPHADKIRTVLEPYDIINKFNNICASGSVQLIETVCARIIAGVSGLFDKIILIADDEITKMISGGRVVVNSGVEKTVTPTETISSSDKEGRRARYRKRIVPQDVGTSDVVAAVSNEINNLNNIVSSITNSNTSTIDDVDLDSNVFGMFD